MQYPGSRHSAQSAGGGLWWVAQPSRMPSRPLPVPRLRGQPSLSSALTRPAVRPSRESLCSHVPTCSPRAGRAWGWRPNCGVGRAATAPAMTPLNHLCLGPAWSTDRSHLPLKRAWYPCSKHKQHTGVQLCGPLSLPWGQAIPSLFSRLTGYHASSW